jgi:hypothetical protein
MKPFLSHSTLLAKLAAIFIILSSLVLNACNLGAATPTAAPSQSPDLSPSPSPSPSISTSLPQAVVTFEVVVPKLQDQEENISLEVLDEVTGLGLNPTSYQMQAKDSSHYSIQLPFLPGSVIKYRFTQEGKSSAVEYNSKGEQVRYRLFYVTGPSHIQDTVTTWGDQPYAGKKGRISGVIVDASSV